MALSTRRRDRSYPTPMGPGFDDSNIERGIAQSQGIASLPRSNVIVDYNLGRGGRDPSMIGGFGLGPMPSVTEVPTDDDRMEDILQDLFRSDEGLQAMPNPIVEPATSYLDPTADDYFLRELYNKFVNPVDPENEGLPMDEFQNYEGLPPGDGFESYDPNNPNMFMLPEGMDLDDMPMEEIIKQMQEPRLEATADTYTLPNLLQMLNDARDAGNMDEIELLTNDLEMMYPGATMTI